MALPSLNLSAKPLDNDAMFIINKGNDIKIEGRTEEPEGTRILVEIRPVDKYNGFKLEEIPAVTKTAGHFDVTSPVVFREGPIPDKINAAVVVSVPESDGTKRHLGKGTVEIFCKKPDCPSVSSGETPYNYATDKKGKKQPDGKSSYFDSAKQQLCFSKEEVTEAARYCEESLKMEDDVHGEIQLRQLKVQELMTTYNCQMEKQCEAAKEMARIREEMLKEQNAVDKLNAKVHKSRDNANSKLGQHYNAAFSAASNALAKLEKLAQDGKRFSGCATLFTGSNN